MEIQTRKKMRKAHFDMIRKFQEVAFDDRCVQCKQTGSDKHHKVTVRGRITEKVNVCGVAKHSPQTVRDKGRL